MLRWSELGNVTEPGDYRVHGLGIVYVDQKAIDYIRQKGGNPQFDLIDVSDIPSGIKQYRMGPFEVDEAEEEEANTF